MSKNEISRKVLQTLCYFLYFFKHVWVLGESSSLALLSLDLLDLWKFKRLQKCVCELCKFAFKGV